MQAHVHRRAKHSLAKAVPRRGMTSCNGSIDAAAAVLAGLPACCVVQGVPPPARASSHHGRAYAPIPSPQGARPPESRPVSRCLPSNCWRATFRNIRARLRPDDSQTIPITRRGEQGLGGPRPKMPTRHSTTSMRKWLSLVCSSTRAGKSHRRDRLRAMVRA